MRRKLLDTFCKAGGATRGYQLAGFEVTGVDIEPQPRYIGERFVQADAFEYIAAHWREYDVIHASPPCQVFSRARLIHGVGEHVDLLTPTRTLLETVGVPWVIENVPGAPMRRDVVLCGSQFGLREGNEGLIRHRWFEFSDPPFDLMPSCNHPPEIVSVFGHGGHVYHGVAQWRRLMEIDWMSRDELAQAIPPAYTEWIGTQLLRSIEAAA